MTPPGGMKWGESFEPVTPVPGSASYRPVPGPVPGFLQYFSVTL